MDHFSKLSIVYLICSLTTPTYAGAMSDNNFTQPTAAIYLGGNLGVMGLADKESTPLPTLNTHQLGATGFIGGGFLGYGWLINDRVTLSIEGFGNGISAHASAVQNYGTKPEYQINMNYNAGVRALPGFLLTPSTLSYLILGYSYGQFHINDNGNYGYVNQSFAKSGFSAGLGLKSELLGPLAVRLDLIYNDYGLQTTYGRSSTGFQSYQNNLSTFEANLAFVYSFTI